MPTPDISSMDLSTFLDALKAVGYLGSSAPTPAMNMPNAFDFLAKADAQAFASNPAGGPNQVSSGAMAAAGGNVNAAIGGKGYSGSGGIGSGVGSSGGIGSSGGTGVYSGNSSSAPPGDPNAPSGIPITVGSDRARVIAAARQMLGVPYQWGGGHGAYGRTSGSDNGHGHVAGGGVDCSGLIAFAEHAAGITKFAGQGTAADQSNYGTATSINNLQPGDYVVRGGQGGAHHIAMYVGNGQIIEAQQSGTTVHVRSIAGEGGWTGIHLNYPNEKPVQVDSSTFKPPAVPNTTGALQQPSDVVHPTYASNGHASEQEAQLYKQSGADISPALKSNNSGFVPPGATTNSPVNGMVYPQQYATVNAPQQSGATTTDTSGNWEHAYATSFWDTGHSGQGDTGQPASGAQMQAYMVSSPYLPQGTRLQVSANGKTVNAFVGDLGPGAGTHNGLPMIDLSAPMAQHLFGFSSIQDARNNAGGNIKYKVTALGNGQTLFHSDLSKYANLPKSQVPTGIVNLGGIPYAIAKWGLEGKTMPLSPPGFDNQTGQMLAHQTAPGTPAGTMQIPVAPNIIMQSAATSGQGSPGYTGPTSYGGARDYSGVNYSAPGVQNVAQPNNTNPAIMGGARDYSLGAANSISPRTQVAASGSVSPPSINVSPSHPGQVNISNPGNPIWVPDSMAPYTAQQIAGARGRLTGPSNVRAVAATPTQGVPPGVSKDKIAQIIANMKVSDMGKGGYSGGGRYGAFSPGKAAYSSNYISNSGLSDILRSYAASHGMSYSSYGGGIGTIQYYAPVSSNSGSGGHSYSSGASSSGYSGGGSVSYGSGYGGGGGGSQSGGSYGGGGGGGSYSGPTTSYGGQSHINSPANTAA